MSFFSELTANKMLHQVSNEAKLLWAEKHFSGVYCGFDPTAPSLHLGNLIPIMLLERFRLAGFRPIIVLGGGTAVIGDPSGKTKSRPLLSSAVIQANVARLTAQLQRFLDPSYLFLNNYEWWSQFRLLDFYRQFGNQMNVNYLLDKENIKNRLETGLTYTEFSYNLLQAYDFYHLYTKHQCYVQIGGSDQWGNIVSGLTLLKQNVGTEHHGVCVTTPLLCHRDGTKFGKTAAGENLWLDQKLTPLFTMYQFLWNQNDTDIVQLLRWFTLLSNQEIEALEVESQQQRQQRVLQQKLAEEVITFLYGIEAYDLVLDCQNLLYHHQPTTYSQSDFVKLQHYLPHQTLHEPTAIGLLLNQGRIVVSNREARDFVTQKALKVNGQVVTDLNETIGKHHLYYEKYLLVQKGKKYFYLFTWE